MALITINGVGVVSGTVSMPLIGVWIADLVIDQSDDSEFSVGTVVSIEFNDGITLKGTVAPSRSGEFVDRVHVRVLGGAGGMGKDATPAGYTQPSAFFRDVLSDLCKASGETQSTAIDATMLGSNLSAWSIQKSTVGSALDILLKFNHPAADWRILADGTLWIGDETWPTEDHQHVILKHDPADAMYEVGCDSPSIYPGITIDGIGKINRVEHTFSSGEIRSQLFLEIPNQDRGFRASVNAIINQETAGIDYFTFYDATVITQSADMLSVDVRPGDQRLSGITRVPLRHGLPGVTVQVTPGATIRIGWDRGNPSMPYAALWQGGETAISIVVSSASIMLGGNGLFPLTEGVVLGSGIDTFTGATYGILGSASAVVMAKKA